MTDFVRVKDLVTGHEYSLPRQLVVDGLQTIDRPATTRVGVPLPPKHRLSLADLSTGAAQETPTPEPDVEPDAAPEEGTE